MMEIKEGVYTDIPNEEYHSGAGVSKSLLDLIHRTPAHAKYALDAEERPEPTEAMKLGTALHSLVLEPKRYERDYAVAPHCDRRTKAGKEEWAAFCAEHEGAQIITEDTSEQVRAMAASIMDHPAAHALLSAKGQAELSAYWTDSSTGILCKCRPDFWRQDGVIVDLKTTDDASTEGFAYSMLKWRYHVQHAFYLQGLQQIFDEHHAPEGFERPKAFVFVAVEKKPPYAVATYVLDVPSVELGMKEARADLDAWAECEKSGNWHGYDDKIQNIALPSWYLAHNTEKEEV